MSDAKVTVEVPAWMERVIKVLERQGRRIEKLTDVAGLESAVEEGLIEGGGPGHDGGGVEAQD